MSSTVRTERVAQEIQAVVAEMLVHGELRDPRIGFVTITGVKVTPDLRTAKIFYSQLGTDEERALTRKGLEAARGFVRRAVARLVKLRVAPEILFEFDPSLDEGDKIERLLKEVRTKEGW